MAFFDKLMGGGDKADKPQNQRAHERYAGQGETVTMLRDGRATSKVFDLVDVSEGGFCISGVEDPMKSGQYFEFRLTGLNEKGKPEADGFATVVRAFDSKLACKFPPQPRLKKFLRDYLGI